MWLKTRLLEYAGLIFINTDLIELIEIKELPTDKYAIELSYDNKDWRIDEYFDSEQDAIRYLGSNMNQRIDLL